jgi:hypothetical protein
MNMSICRAILIVPVPLVERRVKAAILWQPRAGHLSLVTRNSSGGVAERLNAPVCKTVTGLQKVSDKVEMTKPAPQLVVENH